MGGKTTGANSPQMQQTPSGGKSNTMPVNPYATPYNVNATGPTGWTPPTQTGNGGASSSYTQNPYSMANNQPINGKSSSSTQYQQQQPMGKNQYGGNQYGNPYVSVSPPMLFASGGGIPHPQQPARDPEPAIFGLVHSAVPGRTDRHNTTLPHGSYVIPADVVSGMGEGNTLAGAQVLKQMFTMGQHRAKLQHRIHHRNTIPLPPHLADGGMSNGVKCVIAGGEYVLNPLDIAFNPSLGNGNPHNDDPKAYQDALDRGHKVLDTFVVSRRKKDIKTLEKLPGPVK